MAIEPTIKRAIAFFDGQNFYRCSQTAFNIAYPNFDPMKLATRVCLEQGWNLKQVRFYTGLPDAKKDHHWNYFWVNKLRALGRNQKAHIVTRPLRYRIKEVTLPDGTVEEVEYKVEKGIDVRLALDIVSLSWKHEYDVALIFSQDQDLSEVVQDVVDFATNENRWVLLASAFPTSAQYGNRRGINRTDWIPIDQTLYDQCIDPNTYYPRAPQRTR